LGDRFSDMGSNEHDENDDPADETNESFASIEPDVMKCLTSRHVFQQLDDLLFPSDATSPPQSCQGDFSLSETILRSLDFNQNDLPDIFAVLRARRASAIARFFTTLRKTPTD
jgi:hypothetical protein